LRKQPTWAERKLWTALRAHRFGDFKFRRQHPIPPYTLDFYCATARLAIELDGDTHGHPGQAQHDREKDAFLQGHGIRVLRFWNLDLLENFDGVLETVYRALVSQNNHPHPDPLPRRERESSSRIPSPRARGEGQGEGLMRHSQMTQ